MSKKNLVLGEEIEQFLSHKSKATRGVYVSGFRSFLRYLHTVHEDMSINTFVELIYDDMEKPIRKRKRVAEFYISKFVKYLQKEGKSSNAIRLYIAPIRNYLGYKNIPIAMKYVNLPKAIVKEKNHKHKWQIEQIKQFVDLAPNYRDKAVIMCLFQSGLAIVDLLNLNYRDIKKELERGILPVMLKMRRQKTQEEFVSFFGRDAVKFLKLYLTTRKDLSNRTPLFTKWGSDTERLTSGAVESKFREIAEGLDFLDDEDMEGFNPCRPHSLRSGFNSRLMGKIDGVLREFWMGHAIGEVAKAYLAMPDSEMRELYMDAEKYLAIERTSRDELIARKVQGTTPQDVKEDIERLKTTVATLSKLNDELSSEVGALTQRFNNLSDALRLSPDELTEVGT